MIAIKMPTTSTSPERRTSWSGKAESLPLLRETTYLRASDHGVKSYHEVGGTQRGS
jgi:hypothetical protein